VPWLLLASILPASSLHTLPGGPGRSLNMDFYLVLCLPWAFVGASKWPAAQGMWEL
jgi:hypothetical protein